MPWNDALVWTIIGLFSILLAIMGLDLLKQELNAKKEKKKNRDKNDDEHNE